MENNLLKKIITIILRAFIFLPRRILKLISFFESKLLQVENDKKFNNSEEDAIPMNCWHLSISSYLGSEKNNYPLISIVMPIYNSEKHYLEKSIRSCLNQTYRNIELIIIEDGSENDSEELVKSFSDNRIKYIRKKRNEKLPMALNTGFEVSKGQYLTWTSDDNIYMEEAIEVMYNFLIENHSYDFVYCDWYVIDENDNIIGIKANKLPTRLMIDNPIGPCFLYKRGVYETIGDYSSIYFGVEDYEYWIRVCKIFKLYSLRKVLYFYRVHDKSITEKEHDMVLKKHEILRNFHFKFEKVH